MPFYYTKSTMMIQISTGMTCFSLNTLTKEIKQLSFLIARKIHKKGYDGNQFFSEVINDGRLEKLEKDLMEAAQNEVLIEITKKF